MRQTTAAAGPKTRPFNGYKDCEQRSSDFSLVPLSVPQRRKITSAAFGAEEGTTMADNYLQFSLSVPLKTAAELRWVAKTLAAVTRLFDAPGELDEKCARALGPLGRRIIKEEWEYFDAQWSIERARDETAAVGELCLFAEEAGCPEQVAAVLEAYLKKFHPTGVVTFSWAYTCSKLRVNEFGGGAAVVTAERTTFLDAQSWAEDLASKFIAPSQQRTGSEP